MEEFFYEFGMAQEILMNEKLVNSTSIVFSIITK